MAQVREPYSVVGYLAERTPLVQQLQLVHPEDETPVHLSKKTSVKKVGDWELPESGGGANHVISEASHVTERKWTPWDICDGVCGIISTSYLIVLLPSIIIAWAIKRGYFTSRAARPDAYKAGTIMDGVWSCLCHVTLC